MVGVEAQRHELVDHNRHEPLARDAVSRLNDVGGMHGFGPIVSEPDEPPFHAEWEARVFALNRILMQRGLYTLDEFRAAAETIDPARYFAMSYYERWLNAIESLLEARTSVP